METAECIFTGMMTRLRRRLPDQSEAGMGDVLRYATVVNVGAYRGSASEQSTTAKNSPDVPARCLGDDDARIAFKECSIKVTT